MTTGCLSDVFLLTGHGTVSSVVAFAWCDSHKVKADGTGGALVLKSEALSAERAPTNQEASLVTLAGRFDPPSSGRHASSMLLTQGTRSPRQSAIVVCRSLHFCNTIVEPFQR